MTGITRVVEATLIGFMILGFSFGIGYVLDSTPLSNYFGTMTMHWYTIPGFTCLSLLFSWFMGDVILVLFGKADGTGMYW